MNLPKIPIVPAIIPKSPEEVISFVSKLSFAHEVHIDVIDGQFVPTISWPISGEESPMAVKPYTDKFTLEVDLMMNNPFPAARQWEKAGADMIVFHVETVDVESFIDFCKHSNVSVGIAFHGETEWDEVKPYLSHADYLQIMGIEEIGVQGQPFSDRTIEKIETAKTQYPHIPVTVDGSVNKSTIGKVMKAGADRVIVGSAIYKAKDMTIAYEELVSIVND